MTISEAQHNMRTAYLGGFAGQLVSGLIWAIASAVSLWQPKSGMAVLFFGCMFIFPLAQLLLKVMGRDAAAIARDNPLNGLATQIAFTVPVNFLLVGAALLYRENWFFPAAMVVVGAHYLPFIFLYGMRMFSALAGILALGGAGLALYGPDLFSLGGWITAAVLIIFAFVGRSIALAEAK
ncbi:MAG TPA: hypothetical protein PKW33_11685 [Anaerolineaceae bacterium]|nr:hypothetical protein [Anaerolineaceae bacterium]HPN52240.1 hypothetical protein [Anaerolineaceae bacterium]